ncbi:MAG: type I-B CRISPR-associated protein Cas5b [candidate division WOR-3 bacterium]
MRVLVVDIWGSFAHFRVIYTNANSLSYSFPPRTTIAGILAGILGRERDSYYGEFSVENIRLSIRGLKRIKKQIFVVNYYRTKKEDIPRILKGEFENYPMQLELLLPQGDNFLGYRVYIGEGKNGGLYDELKGVLERGEMRYSLSLGLSEFLGWYEYMGEYEAKEIETDEIHSVIPAELFDKLESDFGDVYMEEIPLELTYNDGIRILKRKGTFLYKNDGKPFKLVEKVNAYSVNGEFVIWME